MSKSAVPVSRGRRYFSESARRSIVEEIDNGLSKAEASRKYSVAEPSIYKWIAKYSKNYRATLVTVVEHASDSNKVKQLEAELERAYALVGRLKAENLLMATVMEEADESLGMGLKKNFEAARSQNFTAKKTNSK